MQKIKNQDSTTTDGVFGYVMSKPDNCLHLLRAIFPERHIKWIKPIEQKTANNGNEEKNTRFDVWARDDQGRIYDCEMQNTFDAYFGLRIRYYQSELDRLALKEGDDYRQLKPLAIIFFFPRDFFHGNQFVYHGKIMIEEKHEREFISKLNLLFFNPEGREGQASADLKAFLKYLNGKITQDNKWIEKLDREVKEYVASPEWRQSKMNLAVKISDAKYETQKEDMRKTVANYNRLGASKKQIFDFLLKDYGNDFTQEEIEQIIKEV